MSDHWIELSDGMPLDALDLDPSVLTIDNIAHSLSQINRFHGCASRPISVAEHSIMVADLVAKHFGTRQEQLAGLLHDAPEMVTNDIARPVKKLICSDMMKKLTQNLDEIIYTKFGAIWTPLVKKCDDIACVSEANALMPTKAAHWHNFPAPDPDFVQRIQERGKGPSWTEIKSEFLFKFRCLSWWLKEERQ